MNTDVILDRLHPREGYDACKLIFNPITDNRLTRIFSVQKSHTRLITLCDHANKNQGVNDIASGMSTILRLLDLLPWEMALVHFNILHYYKLRQHGISHEMIGNHTAAIHLVKRHLVGAKGDALAVGKGLHSRKRNIHFYLTVCA